MASSRRLKGLATKVVLKGFIRLYQGLARLGPSLTKSPQQG